MKHSNILVFNQAEICERFVAVVSAIGLDYSAIRAGPY